MNLFEINEKIIQLRKNKWGLFRIHKWLSQWGDFQNLDEIVVLAHILNVLNSQNLNVSKSEIKYCFNKFYKRDFHGDKKSYLKWLYELVNDKKPSHRVFSEAKSPHTDKKNEKLIVHTQEEGK